MSFGGGRKGCTLIQMKSNSLHQKYYFKECTTWFEKKKKFFFFLLSPPPIFFSVGGFTISTKLQNNNFWKVLNSNFTSVVLNMADLN